MGNLYENLPTRCLVCLWMSFSGCRHPDAPTIPEDQTDWTCPYFTSADGEK